jgi:predicted ArsR family transcriptional regulator
MSDSFAVRTLKALEMQGHATFDVIAHRMGEPARRVRWTLDHLRRSGHVSVAGHAPSTGRGRPRAVFTARSAFALQQVW